MKILLAHNSLYFPSHGGGDKSNRLLMEALAERGHRVEVLARLEGFSEAGHEKFVAELEARGAPVQSIGDGGVCFERNGVSVFTVTTDPRLRAAFAKRIEQFDPDVILCSTDDPGALLLEVALRAPRARVVYLVRATVAVPFGPDCAFPNPAKTEMIGRVDSVIGVSEYVAEYVRRWSGFPAIHVPLSLLDPGDYSAMGRFDNEFVLMVNPCAVKGISIFAALAGAMPHIPFAAVPTWGTNPDDIALLRRYPNIRLFKPVDDMATLLRRSRVVLVPSIWAEARSRMVVESMIRGVPVIASDVGGLHEAKLGVEYLLPVNPIQRYRTNVDANMVPIADVPPQDIGPWKAALNRLLTDRDHYRDVSERSRAAALAYADMLHAGWLEAHLEGLIRKPKQLASRAVPAPSLSPAKQKLLALRLEQQKKQRAPEQTFFPDIENAKREQKILFCFPWAGGGTTLYRSWAGRLATFGVCPVRLPGRESRHSEPPFTAMTTLIAALTRAIEPHLGAVFAFYGHSMGAGIAFELARSLRRNGLPTPSSLVVASARAPQLRTQASLLPEPTDEELLEQLRLLGTMPGDPAIERMVLPTLRADTTLYRNYVYSPEPQLSIPLHAFHGTKDSTLTAQQVCAWSEQTSAEFSFTEFPGGHLFLLDEAEPVADTLRAKLVGL